MRIKNLSFLPIRSLQAGDFGIFIIYNFIFCNYILIFMENHEFSLKWSLVYDKRFKE